MDGSTVPWRDRWWVGPDEFVQAIHDSGVHFTIFWADVDEDDGQGWLVEVSDDEESAYLQLVLQVAMGRENFALWMNELTAQALELWCELPDHATCRAHRQCRRSRCQRRRPARAAPARPG